MYRISRLMQRPVCSNSVFQTVPHFVRLLRNGTRASYFSDVKLTKDAYAVQRGRYEEIEESDVKTFQSILDESRVVTDESELEFWNTDWLNTVRGQSKVMLKPKSTNEVSQILKHCNSRRLAICPQGGNTGLVGGSVPVFDEIILSMQLMDKIYSIDPISGVLVCQSGCILENLNNALESHNLIMPLDLGAKGSCHIGGNVSTNAGGIRLLRYGSLKDSCLGIEAVLADGSVLDCLSVLRKDNTGYDLKQLFIGSEGTLGVITAVSILAAPKPSHAVQDGMPTVVGFGTLRVDVSKSDGASSFEDLLKLMMLAKKELGETLSAIEFFDWASMEETKQQLGMTNPISDHPFYLLVEISGSNATHDEEKLSSFAEKCLASQCAKDGTLASDISKMRSIWNLREQLAEALRRRGYTFKYDFSFPTSTMYSIVDLTRERLKKYDCKVYGYGHLGDGNIHLNIVSPQYNRELHSVIEPFVFEWSANRLGSISAEHGIGFKKRNFLGMNKSDTAVKLMGSMKRMLDPQLILNPYKVFPSS